MENDLLESLKDLGYEGALTDELAFSKAIDGGPKSLEYTKLVNILANEIKKLCCLEETVNVMNDADESSVFLLELSAFLKELGCPYKNLVIGHMSSRLESKEDKILLLDYLVSELMAARMVNIDCPKEKPDYVDIVMHESPTAKDLKDILIALMINKQPPNITPEVLFTKLEAKLKDTIQKKEGDKLIGKPLYNKSLRKRQWKRLGKTFTELFEVYRLRRETLITRLEWTIESFEWSEHLQAKMDQILSTYRPKREQMKIEPNVKLSDFLAARSSLLQIEKIDFPVIGGGAHGGPYGSLNGSQDGERGGCEENRVGWYGFGGGRGGHGDNRGDRVQGYNQRAEDDRLQSSQGGNNKRNYQYQTYDVPSGGYQSQEYNQDQNYNQNQGGYSHGNNQNQNNDSMSNNGQNQGKARLANELRYTDIDILVTEPSLPSSGATDRVKPPQPVGEMSGKETHQRPVLGPQKRQRPNKNRRSEIARCSEPYAQKDRQSASPVPRVDTTTTPEPGTSKGTEGNISKRKKKTSYWRIRKNRDPPKEIVNNEARPTASKRPRLDDDESLREERKRPKLISNPRQTSYANTVKTNPIVAVTSATTGHINSESAQAIQVALKKKLRTAMKAPLGEAPLFLGKPMYVQGVLSLWCNNLNTLEWLKTAIQDFTLENGDKLVVKRMWEVPRRVRCGILLPGVELNSTEILEVLRYQNPWAEVDCWLPVALHNQTDRTFMVVSIPEEKVPVLMEHKRQFAYMLGSVYLKFQGPGRKFYTTPPSSHTKKGIKRSADSSADTKDPIDEGDCVIVSPVSEALDSSIEFTDNLSLGSEHDDDYDDLHLKGEEVLLSIDGIPFI